MTVHQHTPTSDTPSLAQLLADAREHDRDLELAELDGNLDDALNTQLAVVRLLAARGREISGWKIGLTSGRAHDLMGPGVRPFGYLLADRTLASGGELPAGAPPALDVEPELCLTLARPLRGDVTADECRAAVGEVRAAFEINRMRVRLPGRENLFVADGLGNWGVVLGSGSSSGSEDLDVPSGLQVTLSIDGAVTAESPADLVIDDVYLSLARLVAGLHRVGLGVEPGQHVITGAFLRQPVDRPGLYAADFPGIGSVSVRVPRSYRPEQKAQ